MAVKVHVAHSNSGEGLAQYWRGQPHRALAQVLSFNVLINFLVSHDRDVHG